MELRRALARRAPAQGKCGQEEGGQEEGGQEEGGQTFPPTEEILAWLISAHRSAWSRPGICPPSPVPCELETSYFVCCLRRVPARSLSAVIDRLVASCLSVVIDRRVQFYFEI